MRRLSTKTDKEREIDMGKIENAYIVLAKEKNNEKRKQLVSEISEKSLWIVDVVSFSKFKWVSESFWEDVLQEGYSGLVDGITHYAGDFTPARFVSYCKLYIFHNIYEFLATNYEAVRLPILFFTRKNKVARWMNEKYPFDENIRNTKYYNMMWKDFQETFKDDKENFSEVVDYVESRSYVLGAEINNNAIGSHKRTVIYSSSCNLLDSEDVIQKAYIDELLNVLGYTLQEISKILKVTKQKVQYQKKKAIKKLNDLVA